MTSGGFELLGLIVSYNQLATQEVARQESAQRYTLRERAGQGAILVLCMQERIAPFIAKCTSMRISQRLFWRYLGDVFRMPASY
jgi:hypothetical protein